MTMPLSFLNFLLTDLSEWAVGPQLRVLKSFLRVEPLSFEALSHWEQSQHATAAAKDVASRLSADFLQESITILPRLSEGARNLAIVHCMIKRGRGGARRQPPPVRGGLAHAARAMSNRQSAALSAVRQKLTALATLWFPDDDADFVNPPPPPAAAVAKPTGGITHPSLIVAPGLELQYQPQVMPPAQQLHRGGSGSTPPPDMYTYSGQPYSPGVGSSPGLLLPPAGTVSGSGLASGMSCFTTVAGGDMMPAGAGAFSGPVAGGWGQPWAFSPAGMSGMSAAAGVLAGSDWQNACLPLGLSIGVGHGVTAMQHQQQPFDVGTAAEYLDPMAAAVSWASVEVSAAGVPQWLAAPPAGAGMLQQQQHEQQQLVVQQQQQQAVCHFEAQGAADAAGDDFLDDLLEGFPAV